MLFTKLSTKQDGVFQDAGAVIVADSSRREELYNEGYMEIEPYPLTEAEYLRMHTPDRNH